jgi:hypothetical protein
MRRVGVLVAIERTRELRLNGEGLVSAARVRCRRIPLGGPRHEPRRPQLPSVVSGWDRRPRTGRGASLPRLQELREVTLLTRA